VTDMKHVKIMKALMVDGLYHILLYLGFKYIKYTQCTTTFL